MATNKNLIKICLNHRDFDCLPSKKSESKWSYCRFGDLMIPSRMRLIYYYLLFFKITRQMSQLQPSYLHVIEWKERGQKELFPHVPLSYQEGKSFSDASSKLYLTCSCSKMIIHLPLILAKENQIIMVDCKSFL